MTERKQTHKNQKNTASETRGTSKNRCKPQKKQRKGVGAEKGFEVIMAENFLN